MTTHTNYAISRSISFLENWLEYFERQNHTPGLAVSVWLKGQPLFNRAYGKADVAANIALTTDHLFHMGSQAKMFTATAILLLASQKKLGLDDLAVQYLPWLLNHPDPQMHNITIRQLVWHKSGLQRDAHPADFWQLQAPFPNPIKLQEIVLKSRLVIETDQRFKYSNLGYAMLGQIIEAAAKQPYSEFVTKTILSPLGLEHVYSYDTLPTGQLATGYLREIQKYRLPVKLNIPTHTYEPVVGWYATANDIASFLCGQLQHKLPNIQKYRITQSQNQQWIPTELRGTSYGWGYMFYPYNERSLFGHGGSFIAHNSYAYIDTAEELAVVVAANAKDVPASLIGEGIFDIFSFFSENATEPTSFEINKFNARLMNIWQTVEIVATNNRIVSIDPDNWNPFEIFIEELEVTSPTKLTVTSADDVTTLQEDIDFHFKPNGRLEWVDYAGSRTIPEKDYVAWLEKQKNTS